MNNQLYDRLWRGDICMGLGYSYPAPGIIEGMCKGWDFVWIDGQHGALGYSDCLGAVHGAASAGVETVLRVPTHDQGIVGQYCDLGPTAVMIPMVNTVGEAQCAVESVRFPPLGKRSYGGRRVIDLHGREYFREQKTILMAQIETLEAVDNAEAIASTDGVDLLFFGPDDAKVRLNLPMNTNIYEHEKLRDAMERTANAAKEAGKLCGTVAGTREAIIMATGMGYSCFVGGSDIVFLRTSSVAKLDELTKAAGEGISGGLGEDKGSGGAY